MLHTAFVALGSNLEEPLLQVRSAFDELNSIPETTLIKKSGIYRSVPMGPQDQPDFINAVAQISTELSPFELLKELQKIENNHKRVRKIHWGPRTLDLDLILYDQEIINTEILTVPHPGLALRSFVLKPMMDINPKLATPLNKTIEELFINIDCSDLKIIDNDL